MRTAILFDLDGTLVDTAPDLACALNHVLAGRGLAPMAEADVRLIVGHGARRMIEAGIEAQNAAIDEGSVEQMFADFLADYGAHIADRSRPFPGVPEALDALAREGMRLGVCTNKPEALARRLLAALGLADRFAAITGGDSLVHRKPHPGHLLGTLRAMKAGAHRAVMVGDSAIDVAAARAAGIPVICVSFGYTETPARALGADIVIDHFDEFLPALAQLSPARSPGLA